MSPPTKKLHTYDRELRVAALAVQRACILTQKVFQNKVKGTVSKDDKSPVTIGDFGAQALIIKAIKHNFPDDEIVGEEDAKSLRTNPAVSAQVWEVVRHMQLEDEPSEAEIGGPVQSEEEMLQMIDLGNSAGGPQGRFWALDPIDGTKGFLRGGQYAVCLALIINGDVKVGVLGCPNLPVSNGDELPDNIGEPGWNKAGYGAKDHSWRGVIFAAALGQGAESRPLGKGKLLPSKSMQMNNLEIRESKFCESHEKEHSSHTDMEKIMERLGITEKSVRMDSQAKYGSIARGAAEIYLRLPTSKTYVEKIWDHAAGDIIVREAEGWVSDVNGLRLDFSQGRMLTRNKGIVATPVRLHWSLLKAVKAVLAEKAPEDKAH